MTLALNGGKPSIAGPLARFNTIGEEEIAAASECIRGGLLSGFLGGISHGGPYVQRLEELWAARFGVRHAIACNSATSGLLAACAACEINQYSRVITTPFTMSATSAAPRLLGATLKYTDVDHETFNLGTFDHYRYMQGTHVKATVVTNLFGHPAQLAMLRETCDKDGSYLIEDNAQSPFAMESGKYAGTIGHIGVWSLNVHKHIHAGEGGIVTTMDDRLADRVRRFVNHGELSAGASDPLVGLNLRMTEVGAAIALAQLRKADAIVTGHIRQAETLCEVVSKFSWLTPPKVREGCQHVFYCVAFKFDGKDLGITRETFVKALAAEGLPLVNGYVKPLYRLPAFAQYQRHCPVAEDLHDNTMALFENCAYTLTAEQIEQVGHALAKIESNVERLRSAA